MHKDRLKYLFELYVRKQITQEEESELIDLLADPSYQELSMKLLDSFIESQEENQRIGADESDALLKAVFQADKPDVVQPPTPRIHFLRRWGWAAASIILLLGIGAYLRNSNKKNTEPTTIAVKNVDMAPGKDGAILTLADGQQLLLDSLENGLIASQSGSKLILKDGQLTYDFAGKATGEIVYNTMSTPKGRQFHVTLPDGTVVYLNAASSITYPTVFNGNERRVKISGELYFDVAPKSKQPFIVETDNQQVEVLGTSFNINCYADEKTVQTTLLTGTVKVTPLLSSKKGTTREGKDGSKVLIPGQTAILNKPNEQAGYSLTITDTQDPGKITAWKNGLFNFDDADLYSVMRQLERWYNIEVRYVGKPDNIIFKGKIHRNTNLSNVLKLLEMMGINFELKDNTLYVR
jgi:transmembrane sensor